MSKEIKGFNYRFKKIIGQEKGRLDSMDAYKLDYLFSQNNISYRGRAVYCKYGDSMLIVFYTAGENDFTAFEKDLTLIVRTFNFDRDTLDENP